MIDIRFEEDSVIEEFRRLGEVALANFFAKNRAELERLVRLRLDRRVARRVDASDILQEAFFESCNRLRTYLESPQTPPLAWVRRLARQVVARVQREHFDAQKRDIRREAYGNDVAPLDLYDLSDAISPPIAKAARKEIQQKIMDIVGNMPALDREILVLVHVENRTVREASFELEIPLETAKKRYRRAILKLKDLAKPLDSSSSFSP
jgi:RNA polymerase sigma-70 factor, ECF subfamily